MTIFNLSVSCSNLNIKSQDDIFRFVFYPLLSQIILWLWFLLVNYMYAFYAQALI